MQASNMAVEASASPGLISNQLKQNHLVCEMLAEKFRDTPPRAIMMVGRGTSDHAGVFAKYLIEITLGIPVFAAAPSIAGVYKSTLNLKDCLVIAISQSGKSPDLINQVELAIEGGATCIALVNKTDSPLAELADVVVPLGMGEEKAVAATKSYLASLSAICQLVAHWKQDHSLLNALDTLPEQMQNALSVAPKLTLEDIRDVAHCVVLGRGFGYAISREIALKMKEVLGLHAEAFSSAEFLHGPVTLLEKRMAVVNVSIKDESYQTHQSQLEDVRKRGGRVIDLTIGEDVHPRLQALVIMQRFYLDIEAVAVQMGLQPDSPPGLKKVTETV